MRGKVVACILRVQKGSWRCAGVRRGIHMYGLACVGKKSTIVSANSDSLIFRLNGAHRCSVVVLANNYIG